MVKKKKGAVGPAMASGVALLLALSGCSPKEEPASVTASSTEAAPAAPVRPPIPAPPSAMEPGDPIAGAKALVAKANNTKKFSEMSELFTNESAAAFAFPVSIMLGFVAGMGDAFSSMGDSLSKMGGQEAKPDEKAAKQKEGLKKMSADLKAFNEKYGLDTLSPDAKPDDAKIRELTRNGRAMLRELGVILETSGQESGKLTPTNEFPSAEEIEYKVLSPTEVKLTPKDPKKTKSLPSTATAKFEDGAWRLSLGTFDEILQEQTKSSGGVGAPGGGMSTAP